ncbi:methylmalonyl-CoA mutase [Ammoniphilus sp. CFH 90114]|nr:methylmalonyl-CoA mutase [Ammoniphilus sp. CFH 90114]
MEMPTFEEFAIPTYEQWRQAAEKALKGASFDQLLVKPTYEGIQTQPIYRQEDIKNLMFAHSLPGMAPFVRGTNALGYLTHPWEVAQEMRVADPKDFNTQARYDLERGQTMLNIVLDRPTWLGQNPDLADVQDVMVVGLSLFTLDDLDIALEGIDLENTPLYINAGPSALSMIALVVAHMQKRNIQQSRLRGCIGADPIAILAEEGHSPYPLEKLYDSMAQTVQWAQEYAPGLQTVIVSGHPYHHGGGNAVQELAFALATGVEYLRELQERDIDINIAARHIRFEFSIGSHLFMEMAKLRAARMLWSNIIQAFGGNEDAQKMIIHARTSKWNKTIHDPYVNMLRGTAEAFSGIIGGVDSLHVAPFDETIREADDFSRRISRNIQHILSSEAHLGRVIDPAGGSWYVEALTDAVAQKAWELFQSVEEEGGMRKSLEKGGPQQKVQEVLHQRQANLASRKDKIVGTNMYAHLEEPILAKQAIDYLTRSKERVQSAHEYRQGRQALALPHRPLSIGEAVDLFLKGVTIGEISQNLVGELGRHQPQVQPIRAVRAAEPFEALRAASAQFKQKTGALPQVFLANMGSVAQHKARTDFSIGFFEVGGFQVLANKRFDQVDEAVQSALDSGATVTVICSSDELYPQVVPMIAKQLKEKSSAMTVIVAGKPTAEWAETFIQAGVDEFIHTGSNCYDLLFELQQKKGISR